MEAIDFEKQTVEEIATTLLDQLRLDLEDAKLDTNLDASGLKYLGAIRKIAHEDPQAIADGFVTVTMDMAALEQKVEMLMGFLGENFTEEQSDVEDQN
jgi:hypothetical protein